MARQFSPVNPIDVSLLIVPLISFAFLVRFLGIYDHTWVKIFTFIWPFIFLHIFKLMN